jgi:hypothetical protein
MRIINDSIFKRTTTGGARSPAATADQLDDRPHRPQRNFWRIRPLFAVLSLVASNACLAAPEEIQVYLDEFAETGKFGLDFHTNYVLSAQPGALTRRMLRVTPELSYGINEHWEAGFYGLSSVGPEQNGGRPVTDGLKVRAKWRPQAMTTDSPWYGAVNIELGQLAHRFYPDGSSGEVKFIGVYRQGAWTFGANLNLDRALKSHPSQAASAELDSKLAYRLPAASESSGELQIGLENYAALGNLRAQSNPLMPPNRAATTFLVSDFSYRRWDFNVGLGRASRDANDRWLLKAIIGVPLD